MPDGIGGTIEPVRVGILAPACWSFTIGMICPAGKEACEAGPAFLVTKCRLIAAEDGTAAGFTGRFTSCRLAWVGVTGSVPCIRLAC
jgi:hypothetical protein